MGRSPSPIWASKQASRRLLAGVAWLLLTCSACRGQYTQPPTACDDHCQAVERADCPDDYPADCVRDCEKARAGGACAPAWRTLDDCYAAADASAFACVNDRSDPGNTCLPERRALSECLVPTSGPCFDECVRQVDACAANQADCEADCLQPAPGCELAAHDYKACLLRYPVECHDWFEPDPRPQDEIPCFNEALTVLGCSK